MLVLLFCKLSEQYSQTNFPIIKPFKVTKNGGKNICIIIIICYIYIALFWVLKALYIEVGESPQQPPMCSIHLDQIKSNQITLIVTSPQHKCLGE